MYEMLAGRPPFTGEMMKVIAQVIGKPPVPPRQNRDLIDPALEAICMKCLEKTAERRYESMGDLAEDLQRFMSGAEVSALREVSSIRHVVVPATNFDRAATTKSWVPKGPTESGPTSGKSWWQFWR
jgi:serine/threonine protein kinase